MCELNQSRLSEENFIFLSAKMQLVAHFQAYFTVTAALSSQCIGKNIGHLLLYESMYKR